MDGRQTTEMRVREAERRFLRHWGWVFPAAGLLLACLTGGGFWAWVDGQTPWLDWRQLFTWRAAVLGGAGAAFWGMWRALSGVRCRGWIAVVLAALGFAAAECAVRIPAAQTVFWLATRARLNVHGPNFMSEVCYIRLEEAAGRMAEAPAAILTGTSQMLCGVDELELGRMLAPTAVIRREVSGMIPQSTLAMWSWIPFRRGDRCVQLRSEMDFTNQAEFRTSWYRPFLTWKSLPMVLANAGRAVCARHRRELVDCAMAASLEGWRMRDGWREIAMNSWKRMPGPEAAEKREAKSGPEPLVWADWEWRAFEKEAALLKEAGVEFWVFEGDVNPVLHNEERTAFRAEVERRMAEGAAEGKWRFVTLVEQDAGIGPEDWADMTHLNDVGREKLTRAMGRVLEGIPEKAGEEM